MCCTIILCRTSSTEEQFFLHSDYPDSQKHKELHRKFTNKIAEFRDSLAKGSAQVSMELLNFLKDWLIHHIQGTDHLYVDYVQRALREEKEDVFKVAATGCCRERCKAGRCSETRKRGFIRKAAAFGFSFWKKNFQAPLTAI